jgi:hypothetical protein
MGQIRKISNQIKKLKCTATNTGFCASWAEEITMSICNSSVLRLGQKNIDLALVLIINIY